MFDHQNRRNFFQAPQSVTSLVAAFMEPLITVSAYLAVLLAFDEPVGRPDLAQIGRASCRERVCLAV